jgi:chemotaxis protein CheD
MQGQAFASDSVDEIHHRPGQLRVHLPLDPEVRVGGMNHFLLAEPPSSNPSAAIDVHYGVYLMEVLVNEMLARARASTGSRRIFTAAPT